MITKENYDQKKAALVQFLVEQIKQYAEEAGSNRQLSLQLGHAEDYVFNRLKRQSFKGLEELYKECIKKEVKE